MKKTFKYDSQPTCYMLIGLPGSGKSTWVERHLTTACTPTLVASSDDQLEKIAIREGITYSEAHAGFFKEAEKAYKAGMIEAARENHDIVVDRTNVMLSSRTRIRRLIESNTPVKYRYVGVVFEVPLDTLKERLIEREERTGKRVSWKIVEGMLETVQLPDHGEFDLLTTIRP